MQTDYIDIYQLHGGTIDDPIDETIEAFEILKEKGKIRHYGISSIRPNVIREWIKRSNIVSVMTQFSMLDRRPEEESLSLLKQNDIGVVVRGALAKGLLAGKAANAYLDHTVQSVSEIVSLIKKVHSVPFESALNFVLAHPAVTSAVVGIRTEAQLHDMLKSTGSDPLTREQLNYLRSVIPKKVYENHR